MALNGINRSVALELWHRVLHNQVCSSQPDLSQRQMAILLAVYLEPSPHTIRGLANRLQVTKPVITRALDSMGELGLVARRRDENDRRNVIVYRTVNGAEYLERLADMICETAEGL